MDSVKLVNLVLFTGLILLSVVWSLPEPSSFTIETTEKQLFLNASRSLYKNSAIFLFAQCKSANKTKVGVAITFVELPCISAPLGSKTEYRYVLQGMGDDNNYLMVSGQEITCGPELKPFTRKEFPGLFHTMKSDAIFFLRLRISAMPADVTFTALLDTQSPYGGKLSPVDYPLLPFYSVMCCVYSLYAVVWLGLCFCHWREMLRIQYWIGAVIFLGMLEKAFFVGEYDTVNRKGSSAQGALVTAELVSCLKRTLARMLFIIVSLGFGIVRPRLGATLHRVVAVGFVYFVASSVEGLLRVVKHKSDDSWDILFASLVLSLVDSLICWWIFASLVRTIRDLALKKNDVKLALYKHFRNTLIFAILASVAFIIWSVSRHRVPECIVEWKSLWLEEAFWHILFSMLLMVIMFLWRPSANSQRYAYSPTADDVNGSIDQTVNDALDAKKIRGSRGSSVGSSYKDSKADDDLKWVEDNIPSSPVDIMLPGILDSDDELKDRKYQASKME